MTSQPQRFRLEMNMANTIFVKGLRPKRMALCERDGRHPNGEVFVAGVCVAEVFPTTRVNRLLNEGRLVRVNKAGEAVDVDGNVIDESKDVDAESKDADDENAEELASKRAQKRTPKIQPAKSQPTKKQPAKDDVPTPVAELLAEED